MLGPNPSLLGEKLVVVSALLIVCCALGGVYGEIVSQPRLPLLMWVFFSLARYASYHSAKFLDFFQRELFPT